MENIFWYIVMGLVAVVGLYAAYIQIRIKRSGIEAEAEVIDVREEWDVASEPHTLKYTYVVAYRNAQGEQVTAALGGLSDSKKDLETGDRILVRYLPDKQEYPIMTKKL